MYIVPWHSFTEIILLHYLYRSNMYVPWNSSTVLRLRKFRGKILRLSRKILRFSREVSLIFKGSFFDFHGSYQRFSEVSFDFTQVWFTSFCVNLENILVDELFEKALVVMSPSTSLHLSVLHATILCPHTSPHFPPLGRVLGILVRDKRDNSKVVVQFPNFRIRFW